MNNFYPYGRLHKTTRRFYTLSDLYEGSIKQDAPYGPFTPSKLNWKLGDIAHALYGPSFDFEDNAALNALEISTLFNDYVFPKFWDSFVSFSDEIDKDAKDLTQEEFTALFEYLIGRIIVWVRESAPTYAKELELYTAIEDDLMAQVKSSTSTKFNDTPQINGEVNTDPYITNLTTTDAAVDSGTPIERLKEVRDNIRNIYESWSKEFRKFVMYN